MGAFQCETPVRSTRKRHRCDCCMRPIPAGSPAVKVAGYFDGDFYFAYTHPDCRTMWKAAYDTYADPYDGMAFDLLEAIRGDEDTDVLLHELNFWRGEYPHVVTRLEFRVQRTQSRNADRLRAMGIDPAPDYPPIYG